MTGGTAVPTNGSQQQDIQDIPRMCEIGIGRKRYRKHADTVL